VHDGKEEQPPSPEGEATTPASSSGLMARNMAGVYHRQSQRSGKLRKASIDTQVGKCRSKIYFVQGYGPLDDQVRSKCRTRFGPEPSIEARGRNLTWCAVDIDRDSRTASQAPVCVMYIASKYRSSRD